jgi:uncharacterized membrane protein
MNASQIHLALTHLPVVLSMTGLIILIISLVKKHLVAEKISLYILVAAGVSSLPVFFSGEGAEEMVENLPGISESLIERHEEIAKYGFFILLATALSAFVALLSIPHTAIKVTRILTLVLALTSSVVMAQTAHLGGQIRHSEIRPGITSVATESSEDPTKINGERKEDD